MFAVLHGPGTNGKSTLIDVIKRVLGDHALTAAFDTFTRQRDIGKTRNDLARLHRARLVVAAESNEGRRLDEAVVKLITGGDSIAVRFLYQEIFEYTPEFKLMLVTNNRPKVEGADDAIWRRIRLIPFEVSFKGRADLGLKETLFTELPGILAWAVAGCLAWQSEGLGETAAVEDASREYRQESDVLGAFLAERCEMDGETEVAEVRRAYNEFRDQLNEPQVEPHVLGKALAKRGINSVRKQGTRCYPITLRGAVRVGGAKKR